LKIKLIPDEAKKERILEGGNIQCHPWGRQENWKNK